MTRDWSIIRRILLFVEQSPDVAVANVAIEGASDVQVAYHCDLLSEAELVKMVDMSNLRLRRFTVALTWKGAEFLDLIRRQDVWDKILARGPLPFDFVREMAIEEVCKAMTPVAVEVPAKT